MAGEIQVLLVEDNAGDAVYLQRKLKDTETPFHVRRVEWLKSALQVAESTQVDVVLLDLSLPDSQGVDTVIEFARAAPEIPIVVMTGHDDMQTAMRAVRTGAQDYVIKSEEIQSRTLERTLLLAIERRRVELLSKRSIHASLTVMGMRKAGESASTMMVKDHVGKVTAAFESVMGYINKNAPEHQESLKQIFDRYELPVVLREMGDILRIDGDGKRRTHISSQALQVVNDVSRRTATSDPPDLPSAQAEILDVIRRRE